MNTEFVAVLVAVPLAVASFLVQRWVRSRRRERVRAWAEAAGHTFWESDHSLASRFEDFEPFGRGDARRAWHVVMGRRDPDPDPFLAFQYEHTTGHGKSRKHHVHTVCVLRTPLPSPGLTLRREHLGHKLFDALGGEDVDVESDEFSRRFWVRCKDRRFAYDVLHPRMMEYLMPHDGYVWQWRGHDLMLVVPGRLEPPRVEAMLAVGDGMVALLPRHLHAAASRRRSTRGPPASGTP